MPTGDESTTDGTTVTETTAFDPRDEAANATAVFARGTDVLHERLAAAPDCTTPDAVSCTADLTTDGIPRATYTIDFGVYHRAATVEAAIIGDGGFQDIKAFDVTHSRDDDRVPTTTVSFTCYQPGVPADDARAYHPALDGYDNIVTTNE